MSEDFFWHIIILQIYRLLRDILIQGRQAFYLVLIPNSISFLSKIVLLFFSRLSAWQHLQSQMCSLLQQIKGISSLVSYSPDIFPWHHMFKILSPLQWISFGHSFLHQNIHCAGNSLRNFKSATSCRILIFIANTNFPFQSPLLTLYIAIILYEILSDSSATACCI